MAALGAKRTLAGVRSSAALGSAADLSSEVHGGSVLTGNGGKTMWLPTRSNSRSDRSSCDAARTGGPP